MFRNHFDHLSGLVAVDLSVLVELSDLGDAASRSDAAVRDFGHGTSFGVVGWLCRVSI